MKGEKNNPRGRPSKKRTGYEPFVRHCKRAEYEVCKPNLKRIGSKDHLVVDGIDYGPVVITKLIKKPSKHKVTIGQVNLKYDKLLKEKWIDSLTTDPTLLDLALAIQLLYKRQNRIIKSMGFEPS